MAGGSGTQKFCKECGTELGGARYCPRCGAVTENAAARVGATSRRSSGRDSGRPWLIAGVLAAAVVVVAVILVAVSLGHRSAESSAYLGKARRALHGVISQNRRLDGRLRALAPAGNPGPAEVVVSSAIAAARSAERVLRVLRPAAGYGAFAAAARAAVSGELAWLHAAAAVLAHPAGPMSYQLAALGTDARTRLQAIDRQVPGASASMPSSASLISYARGKAAAGHTRRATAQFSDQVQALLAQSQPAYEQINELFRQMQTAATGGTPSITLAQAESVITTVIANRTALAASARTLSAPTPLAASVRDALATAMDASLANDHDISNCLNQANTGTIALIFKSCLNSTAASSQAASTAKQRFLALYNQLRSQIGQPATSPQF